MIKKTLLLLLAAIATQSYAFEHESFIKANLNVGATAPYGIPNRVSISGFKPAFSPAISYEFSVYRNESLKLFTGIRYEMKGMTVKADVAHYYTEFYQNGGALKGFFTGENESHAQNSYLTLPVKLVYEFNSKWSIYGGGYASLMFSSKFRGYARNGYIWIDNNTNRIDVTEGEFDFSSNIRKFDAGIELGGKRMVTDRIGIDVNLTAGLVPIFKSEFKSITFSMYNIFLGVGVSYKIR